MARNVAADRKARDAYRARPAKTIPEAAEKLGMSERTPFWHEKASRMIGKRVLVSKTYVRDGQVVEAIQFHGIVEAIDERSGFALRREAAPPPARHKTNPVARVEAEPISLPRS